MKVIKGEEFIYFDCDDTLVSWNYPSEKQPAETAIAIIDPATGIVNHVFPIDKTIADLKLHSDFGRTIVVWSATGSDWAEAVVKKLQLERYVDVVLKKPTKYYDDLPSSEFMGPRIDFSKELK